MTQYNTMMDQDKWYDYCAAWCLAFGFDLGPATGVMMLDRACRNGIVFG